MGPRTASTPLRLAGLDEREVLVGAGTKSRVVEPDAVDEIENLIAGQAAQERRNLGVGALLKQDARLALEGVAECGKRPLAKSVSGAEDSATYGDSSASSAMPRAVGAAATVTLACTDSGLKRISRGAPGAAGKASSRVVKPLAETRIRSRAEPAGGSSKESVTSRLALPEDGSDAGTRSRGDELDGRSGKPRRLKSPGPSR